MTPTGHAIAASVVGGNPFIRIAWGFLSHWILDIFLHEHTPKGLHLTNTKTWRKHRKWLLLQLAGLILFGLITGNWWAILLGSLPDLLEGLWIWGNLKFRGIDYWMKGGNFFHSYMSIEFIRRYVSTRADMTFLQNTVLEWGCLLLMAWG